MGAGRLNERIHLERPKAHQNGRGGVEKGWDRVFTTSAGFTRLRGGEQVIGARLAGVQPTVIKVRYSRKSAEITPEWRAIDARTGEVFNIRTVVRARDRSWIEMTAESGERT